MREPGVFEKPLSFSSPPEPAPGPSDPLEFARLVHARRSVRVFDGQPVPEDVMRSCLELALLAPNSSNLQTWEFFWVRSPERRRLLVEACLSQPAARTAGELVVSVARPDRVHRHARQMLEHFAASGRPVPQAALDYYRRLVPLAYSTGPLSLLAPLKLLATWLLGLRRPIPREPLGQADLKLWAAKSAALACENFLLACRSHGYDSCAMEGLDSVRVKRLLGLPRASVVVMAIAVGRRKPEGVYGPRIRFPSSQFLHEL